MRGDATPFPLCALLQELSLRGTRIVTRAPPSTPAGSSPTARLDASAVEPDDSVVPRRPGPSSPVTWSPQRLDAGPPEGCLGTALAGTCESLTARARFSSQPGGLGGLSWRLRSRGTSFQSRLACRAAPGVASRHDGQPHQHVVPGRTPLSRRPRNQTRPERDLQARGSPARPSDDRSSQRSSTSSGGQLPQLPHLPSAHLANQGLAREHPLRQRHPLGPGL